MSHIWWLHVIWFGLHVHFSTSVANNHDFGKIGGFWGRRPPKIELGQYFSYGGTTLHGNTSFDVSTTTIVKYLLVVIWIEGEKKRPESEIYWFSPPSPRRPLASDRHQNWHGRWYGGHNKTCHVWCWSVDWCGLCGVMKSDPSPLNVKWPITTCLALPCRHVISLMVV